MPSYPPNFVLRSGIDAQVNFMTELTRRSYDALRKLNELNLHVAQQLMQDSIAATRQVLTCHDPVQFPAILANAVQPAARHLHSYQQQLIRMLTGVQAELVRDAESLMPQGHSYSAALAQTMAGENPFADEPPTNTSRANGTSADSTGAAHQAH